MKISLIKKKRKAYKIEIEWLREKNILRERRAYENIKIKGRCRKEIGFDSEYFNWDKGIKWAIQWDDIDEKERNLKSSKN